MKKQISLLLLLSLVGCHGAAEIEGDGYRIRTDNYHHGAPARHCPPGHAKKGWC